MRRLLPALLLLPLVNAHAAFLDRPDVQAYIDERVEQDGFDRKALNSQFRKVKPSPSVLKAIRPPELRTRSWQAYRARFVDSRRVTRGLEFWRRHEAALLRAQARFEVPAEIIVAIIGVETIYGRHTGDFEIFNALANLAFDYPPRAELFRRELTQLLLLAREEQRNPWRYRGSFAGAIGFPQFLPSSIRNYAIDFDQDGRVDLAHSSEDAIGSVARFLSLHGWEPGAPITAPARVSPGDTPALLAEGIRPARLPSEMAAYGVDPEGLPERPAALIDLATPAAPTEYRLGYQNFYVLTRYNRSSFYAAAVADLADLLRRQRYPEPPAAPAVEALAANPTTGTDLE